MMWPAIIETKRLVLRPWRTTDVEALFAYASDPDVGPSAGWLPHTSIEESAEVLENILMVPETYAIVIKGREPEDEPVGSISLMIGAASDLAIGSDEAELGYWLARPCWGQGIMTEAARAIKQHAFDDLLLSSIWAGSIDYNVGSRRVQDNIGLLPVRTIKGRIRKIIGDTVDETITRITREQWAVACAANPHDATTINAQQSEADTEAAALPRIAFIRSGGQTGADRGALDAARDAGIPIRGWCPPGGLAEDMPEPPGLLALYPELMEGANEGYVQRTIWNVRDSHATLIVAPDGIEPLSGTEMTIRFAEEYGRPYRIVSSMNDFPEADAWIGSLGRGLTLNVAGPRESKTPGTYLLTREFVARLVKV